MSGTRGGPVLRFEHGELDLSELYRRGDALAEHLAAIEADFCIWEDQHLVFQEPCFPVVELARALTTWLADDAPGTFVFDSVCADPGPVTSEAVGGGWCVSSSFAPGVRSPDVTSDRLEECVRAFTASVRRHLDAHGLDADWLVGTTGPPSAR